MTKRITYLLPLLPLVLLCQAAAQDVTMQFSDKPADEAFQELAQKSGQSILVESSVKGKVTLSVNDVSFESALSGICQSLEVQWRKLYVDQRPGEELKADSLAAVVRVISAAKLPDVVVSERGSVKPMIFAKRTKMAVAPDDLVKDTGMKLVYLVSNDRAAAKKSEGEAKPQETDKVKSYVDMQAEMLTAFLQMTPEERKEALRQAMQMMMQMDPGIWEGMMDATWSAMDDRMMGQMMQMGTQMFAKMPPDKLADMMARQARMAAEMMKSLPPETLQKITEAMKNAFPPGQGP